MKILVLNCGSSSIKYQLFNIETKEVLAKGGIEKIGLEDSFLKFNLPNGEKETIYAPIPEHTAGVRLIIDTLTSEKYGVVKSIAEIDAVGHRMVHGGEKFSASTLLTDEVLEVFEACNDLAPLHNPANLKGVNAVKEVAPEMPQVGVFDTAFHQTMPDYAYMYALPYEYYEKYGIRRYGFHGTSHRYVAQRAAEMMGEHMSDLRIITCHLGNGASLTAIKYGRSVDTSMGYTPLEGLIMGTRSGEIDPAIIPFLMEKENMDAQQIDNFLNRRSGILGISGLSSDFRDLEQAANNGDERSQLAIDIFAYKVRKYIGGYVAAMGGVDAIVFTAGLGENSPFMREKICNGLEFLGTRIDPELNKIRGKAREISVKRARTKIFVVPTNEELVIARDTKRICKDL